MSSNAKFFFGVVVVIGLIIAANVKPRQTRSTYPVPAGYYPGMNVNYGVPAYGYPRGTSVPANDQEDTYDRLIEMEIEADYRRREMQIEEERRQWEAESRRQNIQSSFGNPYM